MNELTSSLVHLLWIIPLVLLIAYLNSPRFRGTVMEDRVHRALAGGLQRSQYTILRNLVIPSGGGSRRISHVVVSQFGVFVIGAAYRPGRITGTRVQDTWSQRKWGQIHRFDNPLHQSELNLQALDQLVNLSSLWSHSLVVFPGESHFTGPVPDGVVSVENLVATIRKRHQKLLAPETCAKILKVLDESRLGGLQARSGSRTGLTWVLLFLLLAGGWFAFREPLRTVHTEIRQQWSRQANPEQFKADGSSKTDREIWEDSLVCAYSVDTGRCACYEPAGKLAELAPERCKNLAEKGSVLNR